MRRSGSSEGSSMRHIQFRSIVALALASGLIGALGEEASRAQTTRAAGEQVYLQYCASCHDQTGARIPTREALTKMSPSRILRTLDFGLMMSIAYPMERDEREAVAQI